LNQFEVLVCADMLRALEEHVLKEMRKPGSLRSLICRTDVIPQIDRYDRSCLVLRERDTKSVVQLEFFYWYSHAHRLMAFRQSNPKAPWSQSPGESR